MDRRAWVQNGTVVNFIMIRPGQIGEFETDTVALINPSNLDVRIGDTWDGEHFYRNGTMITDQTQGGEQCA